MDLEKNLRDRCKVISGDDGDSFVGVKADTDDAIIYFPIGYQLPENDVDLRIDVQNLFGVLSVFMKEDKVIEARKFEAADCRFSNPCLFKSNNVFFAYWQILH